MVRRLNTEDNMPRKKNKPSDSAAAATPASETSSIRRAPSALVKPQKSSRAGKSGGEDEVVDGLLPAPEKAPEPIPGDPFKPTTVVVNGRTIGQKHATLIGLVQQPGGATIDELMTASGWQKHSVRGFIAGFVKKTLGLSVLSTRTAEGARNYRIKTEGRDAAA
jgi:hypothetical protein